MFGMKRRKSDRVEELEMAVAVGEIAVAVGLHCMDRLAGERDRARGLAARLEEELASAEVEVLRLQGELTARDAAARGVGLFEWERDA